MDENSSIKIELTISADTRDRVAQLAKSWDMSEREVAEKLLADQAEAEASLESGPWLRKHMYR